MRPSLVGHGLDAGSGGVPQDIKSTIRLFCAHGQSFLLESMFARSTVDPYLLHSSVTTAKVIGMFLADAGRA